MPFHLYLLGAFGILFLFLGASELLYRLPLVSVVTKDQIMQTGVPHLYLCLCICVLVYLCIFAFVYLCICISDNRDPGETHLVQATILPSARLPDSVLSTSY